MMDVVTKGMTCWSIPTPFHISRLTNLIMKANNWKDEKLWSIEDDFFKIPLILCWNTPSRATSWWIFSAPFPLLSYPSCSVVVSTLVNQGMYPYGAFITFFTCTDTFGDPWLLHQCPCVLQSTMNVGVHIWHCPNQTNIKSLILLFLLKCISLHLTRIKFCLSLFCPPCQLINIYHAG